MEIAHIMEAIRGNPCPGDRPRREEATADGLTCADVAHSVLHGEIIEDYPSDRPYPSCLILGKTPSGIAVHSVWA
ncbi:MAG: DUF4258 domain-containing protein, partial [Acidobacteriia bacterium]|nr:DUF4258 domain-containing protein [Terriglobia bacterium]